MYKLSLAIHASSSIPIEIFCDEGKEKGNVYYMPLYKTNTFKYLRVLQLWFNGVQGNVLD